MRRIRSHADARPGDLLVELRYGKPRWIHIVTSICPDSHETGEWQTRVGSLGEPHGNGGFYYDRNFRDLMIMLVGRLDDAV